jgi:hypothetical protein
MDILNTIAQYPPPSRELWSGLVYAWQFFPLVGRSFDRVQW